MEINVEWRDGKWPTFNLSLATKEGKDPFIVIKGCGLMKGKNGEFVKFPSKKNEDNTYFNFIYASKDFGDVVLKKAKESFPERQADEPTRKNSVIDMDSDIPFN
jgi:DNA-binding cell septation regulator SpoVG